jgi:CRP-like cAMP-binding protein
VILMNPVLERLSQLPLFAQCDLRELAAVATRTTTVHARRGQLLMLEGGEGQEVYVIVKGTARVIRGGDAIAQLGPGDICGELAALDPGPRTASVVAEDDLVAKCSTAEEFTEILHLVPSISAELLKQLSGRLRNVAAMHQPNDGGYW